MRRLYWLPVLLLPLLLSGCSLLPGNQQSTAPQPTPDTLAIATQVAAAVKATMAALSPVATPPATDPRATAPGDGNTVPMATATAQPAASATAIASGASFSTPVSSATSAPTATLTETPTPVPTPIILAPIQLAQAEIGGGKLYPRYWTNTSAIVFSMAVAPGSATAVHPQVEVLPLGHSYSGIPVAEGALMQPNSTGSVTVQISSLPEGAYHWQARLSDDKGHYGPWIEYYHGPAFRIDRTPPAAPAISSATHPDQRATYSAPMAEIRWTKPFDAGGIQGYQTGVDRKPNGLPSGPLTALNNTVIGPLANGDIYFHVRAEDWAGNLGPVATYVLHIDHRPPELQNVKFDRFQFNPQFDHLTMRFVPNKAVTVRVEVRQQKDNGLVRVLNLGKAPAGAPVTVSWDGRDARGVLVQRGMFTMVVYVTDQLGNVNDGYYAGLGVNYHRIVVHLSTQSMDVYDGDRLLRSTLVTTGNALLPTPPGIWHVLAKFHPYKFISPWKKGNIYYYPPSSVNYALNFHSGGYFIHDAPWRAVYGPGTNTAPGPPGVYSGTHGCVNVPEDIAPWLYAWAQIGTVVQVES